MRKVCLVLWVALIGIGIWLWSAFLTQIHEDMRTGDPVVRLDVARESDWIERKFPIQHGKPYQLHFTTTNFNEAIQELPVKAIIEVEIHDGRGQILSERYDLEALGHVVGYNSQWTTLSPVGFLKSSGPTGKLRVRVVSGDPSLAGADADLKLYRQVKDLGMGGMVFYAFPFIALGFFTLALIPAAFVKIPWLVWLNLGIIGYCFFRLFVR